MYVSQLIDSHVKGFKNQNDHIDSRIPEDFMGIGAGETIEEAVCRGLQGYLDEELKERKVDQQGTILDLQLGSIEDQPCRVYLNALTTLNGPSIIDLREDILGFPVIRVRSNGRWYTKAGLNITFALRNALQQALLNTQNQLNSMVRHEMEPARFS